MQHKCRMTVLDKKLYPELQSRYCADPEAGACPCYSVGDEYVFERYGSRDDFWHMGAGTLVKGETGAAGSEGKPHCSEAWDAISRYIYTALQGGSVMRGWMNDERAMICCCSDGTRPVIFKLERLDYKAIHVSECSCRQGQQSLAAAVASIDGVTRACWHRDGFLEAYMDGEVSDETIRAVVEFDGRYRVERID